MITGCAADVAPLLLSLGTKRESCAEEVGRSCEHVPAAINTMGGGNLPRKNPRYSMNAHRQQLAGLLGHAGMPPPSGCSGSGASGDSRCVVFRLSSDFVSRQRAERKPQFGFNGLGELVYRRTYARTRPENNAKEDW